MQRFSAEYERTINIWQASILGENTVVRELLADGEDVEAVCRDARAEMDGRTALSFAATYDNLETVELLLEHGADPKRKNVRGFTPKELAAREKREDAIAIFDELGF